jgi:hypothetical protein
VKRLALIFLSIGCIAGAAQVSTPQEQCEQLLNAVLPLAEKLLVEHGEFYPFGASLKANDTVAMVSAYDGDDKPESQPLIELLRYGLKTSAGKGEIIASAVAYDVRVTPPGSGNKTDAVAVELEHKDDYAVVVYFPYQIKNKVVAFGEAFANRGSRQVFADGA